MNMLIVDDEPIICQGLRYTIDWESIGVSVVGEAYSGVQALALAERLQVDLVLTDIQMKNMDGLALTERLKEKMPDIRVIIISGFDQFSYAQQALRLGVQDYLLKPIQIDELLKLVTGMKAELDRERSEASRKSAGRWTQWLMSVAGNSLAPEGSPPFADSADSALRQLFIAGQLEQFERWSESVSDGERSRELDRWKEAVDRLRLESSCTGTTAWLAPNLMVSVWIGTALTRSEEKRIAGLLAELAQRRAGGKAQPMFAVSEAFPLTDSAREHAQGTIDWLKYIVLDNRPAVIGRAEAQRLQSARDVPASLPEKSEKELFQAMFKEEQEQVAAVAEEMLRFFRQHCFVLKEALAAYEEVRAVVVRRLRACGIKRLEESEQLLVSGIDLNRWNSYESLGLIIRQELLIIHELVQSAGAGKHFWVIERAKQYMAGRNLSDLKASDVAAVLNITPSYFSLLFKQHTGKSFTEYVNDWRIEQAKRMLEETSLRVFEIANAVGYKEYKYFVSVFKEYTGMTPSDYRGIRQNDS